MDKDKVKGKAVCAHCGHAIFRDEGETWHHKSMLHNDNCDCRNPEPKGEVKKE